MNQSASRPRTVLVTGANGYLGSAIARAFSRAGWFTYGLIRRPSAIAELLRHGILPVLGSAADHQTWLSPSDDSTLPIFDVVVCTTEDFSHWEQHFQDNVSMFKLIAAQRQTDPNTSKGQKLLVLFTSGCKDYGPMTTLHGNPSLAPHTEDSPLNPPDKISPRTQNALRILEFAEFDAVSLRPTTFYGQSATYYGILFDMASRAADTPDRTLTLDASPDSILHGTHVDDCGDAYVSIAESPDRSAIASQIYNISSEKYDTLSSIATVMQRSYGIKIIYAPPPAYPRDFVDVTVNFPQWVGSDKLRAATGWTDKRLNFVDGFEIYRRTYEQLAEDGDENIKKIRASAEVAF